MRILYLSTWDFTKEESDGVCKKIKSQIAGFTQRGYEVDFTYIKNGNILYRENGLERTLGKVGTIKKTPAYIKIYRFLKEKRYDWVYNRYGMMDTFYYRVLEALRRNGAKILIELPTYPYAGERPKGLLYWLMFQWDRAYLEKLKTVIDEIVTYSLDDEIFGIKTIKVKNGVDFSQIKIKEVKQQNGCIDLIGVAHLSRWHGFDRIISGMKDYYERDVNARQVNFHIVGSGSVLQEYKGMTQNYSLEDHVFFYGDKSGEELDKIYDKCDIAVSSLGLHRIGLTGQASVLKSREYGAKGLPIISSIGIDIFRECDFKYIKYVPEDDSPIDIRQIVEFYDEILKEKVDIRYEIRNYAYTRCDKNVVLEPVIRHMEGR